MSGTEMPASFGVHGPGEMTIAAGAIRATSSTVTASLRTTSTAAGIGVTEYEPQRPVIAQHSAHFAEYRYQLFHVCLWRWLKADLIFCAYYPTSAITLRTLLREFLRRPIV
jgi:hypothetical protein